MIVTARRRRGGLAYRGALAGLLVGACSTYDASLLAPDTAAAGGAGTAGHPLGGQPNSAGGASGGGASAAAGTAAGTADSVSGGSGGGNGTGSAGTAAIDPGYGAGAGGEAMAGEGGGPAAPDSCPDDPDKLEPGACGCGVPDVSTVALASCKSLIAKLSHRYDFEGGGTKVTDRIGTAHGVLVGGSLSTLDGEGVALLGGGTSGAYVDLPNQLISKLSDVTLEAWVTWGGGSAWQRVFDFGDTNHAPPENNPDLGKTYLMLTPSTAAGVAAIGFSVDGNASGQEQDVSADAALPTTMSQVVVVASDSQNKLRLYIDGKLSAEAAWTGALSQINDVNAWLGRSQYDHDPELSGVYHDFRIYSAALTDAEVASSFRGGTDPSFLAY